TLPARYGVHAMELLINAIMKRGGDRRRLQAKVFGGAKLMESNSPILNVGQRNAEFVKEFLSTEGIPIVSQCLGGRQGLKVRFFVPTGKALVKPVAGNALKDIKNQESSHRLQIRQQLVQANSEQCLLF